MSVYALLDPAVNLAYTVVTRLASALPGPTAPGAEVGDVSIAVAIVLLTLAVRAALVPLSLASLRAGRARQALAPELDRLRRRHRDDPSRLAKEVSAAHRKAGVSPFAGLLPSLAQLPVITTMYRLVVAPTIAGHPNTVLAAHLFGAPLAAHWPEIIAVGGVMSTASLAVAAVAIALLALAWLSSRQISRQSAGQAADEPPSPATGRSAARRRTDTQRGTTQRGGTQRGGTQRGGDAEAAAARVAGLVRWVPYGTVLFAAASPIAVGIYLLATTTWTVTERAILPRLV